VAVISESIR